MDVFKLAFETTVVGLLAFIWLGVAAYLLFPEFLVDMIGQKIPMLVKENQAAVGVGVLTVSYCLGSAILPIANQLVDDEHWPLNERAIRCQVFVKQEGLLESVEESALPKNKYPTLKELKPVHCSYWAPIFTGDKIGIGERIRGFFRLWVGLPAKTEEDLPGKQKKEDKDLEAICVPEKNTTECNEFKANKILAIFHLQETAVMNQGPDRTEQLRQLHERIVVLRGTIFSGFVLFLICLFAYFARLDGHTSNWVRPACGILLAVFLAIFSAFNGYHDLASRNIFDIPVLESLLLGITAFGGVLAVRRAKTGRFLSRRYVLAAMFFTGLAYGGWMWSEILYDQQVIISFAALPISGSPGAQKQ